MDTLLYYQQVK